jgi:hypothetical protein
LLFKTVEWRPRLLLRLFFPPFPHIHHRLDAQKKEGRKEFPPHCPSLDLRTIGAESQSSRSSGN